MAGTSSNMTAATSNIYQLKITLKRSKPSIWRRVQVPETFNFYDLHVAIQDVMGWYDCHLHKFEIKNPKTGKGALIGIPDDSGFFDTIHEVTAKIADYFKTTGDRAVYEYDFGDGWMHNVVLEKILPAIEGIQYPQCTAGKMACPPENCGGIDGYKELLEIIANPEDGEYAERMEWLEMMYNDKFDSKKFDPKLVNFNDPKDSFKTASGY